MSVVSCFAVCLVAVGASLTFLSISESQRDLTLMRGLIRKNAGEAAQQEMNN